MNAAIEPKEPQLPAPVARRGITEAQWRTAMNSLFPGARAESVVMVFDYCLARKLDPLKKPCHIVPMKVRNQEGEYVWRDVVMPGIYEYRTTATRTGLYMGHSVPVYGEVSDYLGRMVPSSCSITVYRWNPEAKQKAEYPVTIWFEECCATKWDKEGKKDVLNDRWDRAPRQMLTKCAEAAALREAFPDELGGTHTADEMEGQHQPEVIDATPTGRVNPRGDTSHVDWELRDKWVGQITDILADDVEEHVKAQRLREADIELSKFAELAITVADELQRRGVCSKSVYKKWLKVEEPAGREHDVG